MLRDEVIKFHNDVLNDYKEFWESEEDREIFDMTLEEAGYGILEHSGMLYRYTADRKYIDAIQKFDIENLVKNAFEYINGMTIVDSIKEIISSDIISEYNLENAEILIEARDALEIALLVISEVIKPLVYAEDFRFLDRLTAARCYAHDFDEVIQKDLALFTLATRNIAELNEFIEIEISKEDFWWFHKARDIDSSICEQEEKLAGSISEYLTGSKTSNWIPKKYLAYSGRFRTNVSEIADWAKMRLSGSDRQPVVAAVAHLKIFAETGQVFKIPLAALDAGSMISPVIIWRGDISSYITSISDYEAGEKRGIIGSYARLTADINRYRESVYAQWKIAEKTDSVKPDSNFFLIEMNSNEIIGEGIVDGKSVATLQNGSWEILQKYSDDPSGLLILILDSSNVR